MSADIKGDLQAYDDINITPMLDLAYVLLVTFIIMTTASVQGVKVKSPVTQAANNLAKPQTRGITITTDGQVYLDAYPVTMDQLRSSLAQYKAANPNLPVVLKADASAQYEKVMDVLNVAKSLDITEIGLVTKRAQ
ncbi:MAG: biopolymer transporter ExbD [Aquabacterium sp.]|uniref:ExbD/TolR family protein n=1 Tax=unclassified Aquabacterium TaxID=2620789 RepID=UPI001E5D9F6B|nr:MULTISPECIES: biopolymer transporter ExbD [unclassified Aquabacterium]MDO9002217.1 biopolymer transporter ExbD [Aquabacterium sp.]CAH0351554.1 Biopolymer transport protein ExbD [Aquabacterium sp. CECT 9606]